MLPMQDGDVIQTWADISKFKSNYKYEPTTSAKDGVKAFINWYKSYNNLD